MEFDRQYKKLESCNLYGGYSSVFTRKNVFFEEISLVIVKSFTKRLKTLKNHQKILITPIYGVIRRF